MPKGGGHGGSSKQPRAPFASNEEGSNVVFGNAKSAAKKANKRDAGDKPATDRQANPQNGACDEPKKPDTRTLIGGASWTGKLPVNMLSEHCQKQKWAKPEYTMVLVTWPDCSWHTADFSVQSKTPEGFSSMVILKAMNPKTRETVALPSFQLPPRFKHLAVQRTAVEARQFAATYALFRVCSMKNIHVMLPPSYRDLWKKQFQESRNEDVKEGRAWMYEADPFVAKQEREEAQALMAKKKGERENQKVKEAPSPANVNAATRSDGGNTDRNVLRWTDVPKIDMGKRTRAQIEGLVRREAIWNPNQARISEFQRRNIIHEFTGLGFRRIHVEEAVAACKDREESLEWLLIHVPEDDLPKWSLPGGYSAGVSLVSGNLKRETSIARLAEAGYSYELCTRILDECGGRESRAAQMLQNALIAKSSDGQISGVTDLSSLDSADAGEGVLTWSEEQETLDSILGDRFVSIAPDVYQVQLQPRRFAAFCTLAIRRPENYPQQPPIVSIISPGLPAYIRLSIIRQLIQYANANLLGEPMIYLLVDWLENEIAKIVDNPGLLSEVSAAACGQREMQRKPRKVQARSRLAGMTLTPGCPENIELLTRWQSKQATPQQAKMLSARKSLPAWKLRDDIVSIVNSHQVTIISGETGSGKSTQSVQFILDDMIQRQVGTSANIFCTQPRRISVLGLADRVSDERCSTVGDEVGYAIRGESKQKPGITKITFVTTGVLLRQLQTSGGTKDGMVAALADVSHVVVDEVHERSLDTDILLVLLRDVLAIRKDLRVILMSATLDSQVFETYFSTTSTTVGRIEIQGRTFPVQDFYLDDVLRLTGFDTDSRSGNMNDSDVEDPDSSLPKMVQNIGMNINYELIAKTVRAIDSQLGSQEGGILIFLPGTLEINRTLDAMKGIRNTHVLPLHASLMPIEQRRVFPPAPKGKRKVIAATNVAETSITIEDIVAVIDCGKVKETSFDPQNNVVKLEEVWASRGACKQRRGRAGRVQSGECYKLYSRNAEHKMVERPEPEIRRVPLEQLCLSVRAMGIIDVSNFLASALTPPNNLAVEGALALLARMGALDGDNLTALGRHLSMIPADLRCGKLMVYGATFGCLEACLTIAAILTVRSPFVSPQAKREESKAARMLFAAGQGDLVCDLRAYEEWSNMKSRCHYRDIRLWCEKYYLSNQTLEDITANRTQYLSSLKEAAFLPSTYQPTKNTLLNAQNSNNPLIRALIAGAFNPQLARINFPDKRFAPSMSGAVELDPEARTIKFFNQDNGRVFVHPSSTLFSAQSFPGGSLYLGYFHKMATSKVFIRELTPFNAYSLLLFSGPISLDTLGRGLLVDGWLRLRGWARIGVLVSRLRTMLDDVLARKLDYPSLDISSDEVVAIVRKLVEFDGLDT